MLRGCHEHTMDPKGRVALPIRFREELMKQYDDDRIVLTLHLSDPCLVMYPLAEWKAFEAKLAQLPQFDPTLALVRRLYGGRAHDCTLDKQGRLLVPPDLRRDGGIEREAVWSGQTRFAELWGKDAYEAHVSKLRAAAPPVDVLAKLAELGL